MTKTVIVKPDRSPVSDLKRPFNNRMRRDSTACGSIELAYLRGHDAGLNQAGKLILRLEAVVEAAKRMPRKTPKSGGASTMYSFKISAADVWELDRALKALRAFGE